MPYDAYLNEIPSKAEKKTNLLTFGDIGGVGQLVYHNFRYRAYSLAADDTGKMLAVPTVNEDTTLDVEQKEDLDGNTILTSLCDLARRIDSFETKDSYQDAILNWCTIHMHPYRIDEIYTLYSCEADIGMEMAGKIAARDGIFAIDQFMADLGRLYYAARLKRALDGVAIAEEEDAYNLYAEGRFFEAPAVFEKYKNRTPIVPDELIENGGDINIVDAMQLERQHEASHPQEPVPEGAFAEEPYDDYESLRERLLECFPDFRLRLKAHPKDGRIVLSAEVDSVFDIAWYALAHLITEEPLPQDIGKTQMHPEGILATCKNCGHYFIRRNSRNHYCDREECQKARNARNQREFRKRRAEKKAHAKNQE